MKHPTLGFFICLIFTVPMAADEKTQSENFVSLVVDHSHRLFRQAFSYGATGRCWLHSIASAWMSVAIGRIDLPGFHCFVVEEKFLE